MPRRRHARSVGHHHEETTPPVVSPEVEDTFNRTNAATLGTSSSGDAWTEWTSGYQIVSNRARPDAETAAAAFTPELTSSDQYAEATVGSFTAGISSFIGPIVRAPATIAAVNSSTGAFYFLTVSGTGMESWTLRRKDALVSSSTPLAVATRPIAAGDVLRVEAQGDVLRGYHNGTLVLSYTGAVLTDQKRTGLYIDEGTGAIVEWESFAAGLVEGAVVNPEPEPEPPPPAGGDVLWQATPEAGGLGGWTYLHSAVSVGITSAASGAPVRNGTHSFYSEVRDGVTIFGTERSEWANGPGESTNYRYAPGDETYTAVSVYPASDFPTFSHWSLVTQWKGPYEGTPPQQISLISDQWAIVGSGQVSPRPRLVFGTIQRGAWNDFIVHHRWSSDPTVGFVEVWFNGVLALPKTFLKTCDTTTPLFLDVGMYRDSGPTTGTARMWIDAIKIGLTKAAVAP
jgi:hypothetical protein